MPRAYYGSAEGKAHEFFPMDGPIKARLVIQDHYASRHHWDLRLIIPGVDYAYSWAIPKHRWPDEGERLLAVETVPHSLEYVDQKHPFVIPEGEYGAGKVYKAYDDTIVLHYMRPTAIRFDAYVDGRPRSFILVRRSPSSKDWLFIGLKREADDPPVKWKDMSQKPITTVLELARSGWIAQPKIDGVGIVLDTTKGAKAYVARSGLPVMIPEILERAKLSFPEGKIYGELFLVNRKTGRAAPPNIVSGFVRSRPSAREKYLSEWEPKVYLFDVAQIGSRRLTRKPYGERLKELMSLDINDSTFLKPIVFSWSELPSIVDDIFSGKHPLTREGIVLRDPQSNRGIKYKSIVTYDVYVCDIFEGKGRLKGKAGGFYYSFDPDCRRIDGKVGTGLDDRQREHMWKNKDLYRGAVAVVAAMPGTRTLIQPRFIMWHPDKNIRNLI